MTENADQSQNHKGLAKVAIVYFVIAWKSLMTSGANTWNAGFWATIMLLLVLVPELSAQMKGHQVFEHQLALHLVTTVC